jgi:hypothetical protein
MGIKWHEAAAKARGVRLQGRTNPDIGRCSGVGPVLGDVTPAHLDAVYADPPSFH